MAPGSPATDGGTSRTPSFPAAGRRVFETCPDRKSTRLNSSHSQISYAVFCLKKKKLADAKALGIGLHETHISLAQSPQLPGQPSHVPAKPPFRVFVDYAPKTAEPHDDLNNLH